MSFAWGTSYARVEERKNQGVDRRECQVPADSTSLWEEVIISCVTVQI